MRAAICRLQWRSQQGGHLSAALGSKPTTAMNNRSNRFGDAREEPIHMRALRIPDFPRVVRTAAVLWIIYGILGTLEFMAALWIWRDSRQPWPIALGTLFGPATGVVMFIAGLHTACGCVRSTLLPSILSLTAGLGYFGVGLFGVIMYETSPSMRRHDAVIAGGLMSAFFGAELLLGASLGLIGYSRYRRWKEATRVSSRR